AGRAWTLDQYQSDLRDPVGGHAFTIIGYDDNAQTLHIMNSWGTQWGKGGFWDISYEVIQSALELSAQGQAALELWVTVDNTGATPDNNNDLNSNGDNPDNSSLLAIANVSFDVDASDNPSIRATFDLQVDSSLQSDQVACIL